MKHPSRGARVVASLLPFAIGILALAATTDPGLDDEETERFLLEAAVVTRLPSLIPSTTSPMMFDLELDGKRLQALFKYSHSERPSTDTSEIEGTDQPSLDSYRHEVAAYRLDRALGLGMVPVAVIRHLYTEGALIEWIPNAFTEEQRRERGIELPDARQLVQQRAVMRVFDALILNVNRGESDQLVTNEGRLRLIDHSRGFRKSTALPRSFIAQPVSLSRSLLTHLEQLESESLDTLLGELLDDAQIAALLERRNKILDKIESDRAQYGDATVFQGQPGHPL